jgi:signal transduction histidine kinase
MNAIKFTPTGGKIDLEAFIETFEDGQYLCFSVTDTGVGIPPKELDQISHLFDPIPKNPSKKKLKPLKDKAKVTGIGLPLISSFIRLHGGTISVSSIQGEGTTFICRIPLLSEIADQELLLRA